MRILIYGSNFLKLLSSVIDFDQNEVIIIVNENFEEFSVKDYFTSKIRTKILYFEDMDYINFNEFNEVDLFISSSKDDKSNALFMHRVNEIYPNQEKITFIKDAHFAELQRDFGFKVLSSDELLRERLVDLLGG